MKVVGTFHVPSAQRGGSVNGKTGCGTRRVPATFSAPSRLRVSSSSHSLTEATLDAILERCGFN